MNVEEFEFKKPGCDISYKLKIMDGDFYVWKYGKWVFKKFKDNYKGYYQSGFNFTKKKTTMIRYHRLIYFAFNPDWNIWDTSKQNTIDHISIDKTNNDISNLRILTQQQQCWNKNCKGYYFIKKSNKWQAKITFNGITKHLGYFETEEEAKQAYQEAKAVLHRIVAP